MKKKIIGIIICTLMTTTILLPTVYSTEVINKPNSEKTILENLQLKCAFSGVGDNLDKWAKTPTIDISGISQPCVEIYTLYEILPFGGDEYGRIKISENGGSTWTELQKINGYTSNWITMEVGLGNITSNNIIIGFEYTTKTNSNSDGWWIEKIIVKGSHEIYYSEDFSGYDLGDPFGEWTITVQAGFPNAPPDAPIILGPINGKPNVDYNFTLTTTDLDGDNVFYYIEWGDGTNTGYIGPYQSGELVTKNHTWTKKGTYTLKAKAKDTKQEEMNTWGTLTLTLNKNKGKQTNIQQILEKLIEWILSLFPIFNRII
jgi:hypothetical protein